MMRIIDADKLKRKVQRVATDAWKMKLTASIETTLNQFIDYVDEAPTIEIPTWIPCSERLPSNFGGDETVLATTDVDGRRVVLMLAADVERFYLKGYVSAWMPSPKPWEGANDE